MWEKILEILTYFIIYSFMGWVIESTYKSILQKQFVNSGFLHGPFCPIYGIGALIMFLFLQDYKENSVLIFCLGFVVLSIWEYFVGVFLEKVFKTKYWDYSNYKYNLQGRVCLLNSIFWGLLGIIFINFVHPFVQSKLELININIIITINIIVFIYLAIDAIISCMKVIKIDDKLRNIEELNKKIKEKLEELKQFADKIDKSETQEKLQQLLNDLKVKKEQKLRKLYMYATRIRKAFPNISSENLIKLSNEKIEKIKKNKQQKNI